MQVKSIAECSNWSISAILSTFIKLPIVIKRYLFSSNFEWLFYTGFTVNKIVYGWKLSDSWYSIKRGSYMSVHALLKLLYELSKRDKMRGLLNILWLFRNEFNESSLLDPI